MLLIISKKHWLIFQGDMCRLSCQSCTSIFSLGRGGVVVDIEYQSVCPFVGIGFPPPPPTFPASESVSPLGPKKGGGSNTPLLVRGWVDPIRTNWQKAWHSVYFMVLALDHTVCKMDLILRSIERRPQMQFSMARRFMLQLLRRYSV